MRFGSILRKSVYEPWAEHYLDYGRLKKLLREPDNDDDDDYRGDAAAAGGTEGDQGVAEAAKRSTASGAASSDRGSSNDDPWTDDDEGAFVEELVNVQLEKVHAFHARKSQELRERLARCEAALEEFVQRSERGRGKDAGGSGGYSSPDGDANSSTGAAAKDENDRNEEEEEGNRGKSGESGEEEEKEKEISHEEAAGPLEHDERQRWLRDVLEDLDGITKEVSELERFSRINFTGFLKAAKKHDRKRGSNYRVQPLLQVRLGALPFNSEDYSPLLYRSVHRSSAPPSTSFVFGC
jgi:SPX domain protein involved in polyphosphate accumulation